MRRITTALLIVACYTLTACSGGSDVSGTESTKSPSASRASTASTQPGTTTGSDGEFHIEHASWGPVEQPKPEPTPPVPTRMSVEAGERQAFERGAAERWKNTEVFVRR